MNPQDPQTPLQDASPEQLPQQPLQGTPTPSYDWQQVALPPSEQTHPPQSLADQPVQQSTPYQQPQQAAPTPVAPQPYPQAQQFSAPSLSPAGQPESAPLSPAASSQPPQPSFGQPIYPDPLPGQTSGVPYAGGSFDDKRSPLPFVLGGVGIIVLLILGGVGAYFFSTPSRTDYNDAIDTYNEVAKANNSLSLDLLTFTNPTGAVSEEALKQKHDSYKSAFSKLEGLKALRNQSVDGAYKAFVKKNTTATKITEEIIDSFDELTATNKACEAAEIETLQPCIDAMKALGDSTKNETIKTYAQASVAEYENFLKIYQTLQAAYAAGDGAAYSAAYGELATSAQTISDLNLDFLADADKMNEDANLKKEADAFKTALETEAKKAPF